MINVTVCGDSQIAQSIAAVCAWRGHTVRVLSKKPRLWSHELVAYFPNECAISGRVKAITDDPRAVIRNADVIFICVDNSEIAWILQRIAPHVRPDTLVGAMPGFGGFGLLARRTMPAVRTFFGAQRIPFVIAHNARAGVITVGGIRRQTFIGAMPAQKARPTAELIQEILGIPTVPTSHYFNIELSPSNSIVNPARLYALFGPEAKKGPKPGQEFFSDWNQAASRVLLRIDSELQSGRRYIPRDTSFVAPILLQYDANDFRTLTDRIRNLSALAGRPVPDRRIGNRIVIDPGTKYLTEDIDHGLKVVRDILRLAGGNTPLMDRILQWREGLQPPHKRRRPVPASTAASFFSTIDLLASALD